ncbi:bifunctional adenosylcobinamide kinase/adenosylcobinamide-phosphate guanylyltransferase [Paenibacillus lutrae]|uniref:Adenosylcobinamide kinase n=1 Tax=Paenibacillus lutrae TaxID=2078573 RepID=A0A7X3JYH7_9BACL|nr:bifunctional adenosylcobinamide kinase/adenosylcobinamide-phosphate guanylyltransferase [Paenibacillus lutrae]MVO98959.1 bifunctional adenosylcobinamide kinase/adenosylcobinamide-phosphate guanylyltransferase [Paenibacillus lutrae]
MTDPIVQSPILVTGGARSGKSSFAEQLSARLADGGTYIATAQIWDEEMRERVGLHRRQREVSGFAWTTLEEPLELPALLRTCSAKEAHSGVVLVDCLTLWLSNCLLRVEGQADAASLTSAAVDELVRAVQAHEGPLVLVTNEVGSGIVPEYPLGRLYRDLAGRMNQRLASVCGQVFLVTAGIPVELKSRAFRFE